MRILQMCFGFFSKPCLKRSPVDSIAFTATIEDQAPRSGIKQVRHQTLHAQSAGLFLLGVLKLGSINPNTKLEPGNLISQLPPPVVFLFIEVQLFLPWQ